VEIPIKLAVTGAITLPKQGELAPEKKRPAEGGVTSVTFHTKEAYGIRVRST
jgi:hypothetical protein